MVADVVTGETEEMVAPIETGSGDGIEDPIGRRWLNVNQVRVLTTAGSGAYSFFGSGPNDRITFEGDERVKRRKRRNA